MTPAEGTAKISRTPYPCGWAQMGNQKVGSAATRAQPHRCDAVRWRPEGGSRCSRRAPRAPHAAFSGSIQNLRFAEAGPPVAIEHMPALDRIVGADAWRQAFPGARYHDHRSWRSVWAQLQTGVVILPRLGAYNMIHTPRDRSPRLQNSAVAPRATSNVLPTRPDGTSFDFGFVYHTRRGCETRLL